VLMDYLVLMWPDLALNLTQKALYIYIYIHEYTKLWYGCHFLLETGIRALAPCAVMILDPSTNHAVASTQLIKILRAPHTDEPLGMEPTTSLSSLGLCTHSRANAGRTSAASARAVSSAEALTTNELSPCGCRRSWRRQDRREDHL
jgi:hypothetical protein